MQDIRVELRPVAPLDRRRKRFRRLFREQHPRRPIRTIQDRLQRTSAGIRDNGLATRHGFDRHDTEILLARERARRNSGRNDHAPLHRSASRGTAPSVHPAAATVADPAHRRSRRADARAACMPRRQGQRVCTEPAHSPRAQNHRCAARPATRRSPPADRSRPIHGGRSSGSGRGCFRRWRYTCAGSPPWQGPTPGAGSRTAASPAASADPERSGSK